MASNLIENVIRWVMDQSGLRNTLAGNQQVASSLNQAAANAQTLNARLGQVQSNISSSGNSSGYLAQRLGQVQSNTSSSGNSSSYLAQRLQAAAAQAQALAQAQAQAATSAQQGATASAAQAASIQTSVRLLRGAKLGGGVDDPFDAFAGSIGVGTNQRRAATGRSIQKAGRELFLLPDIGPSTEISRSMVLAGSALERMSGSASKLAAVGVGAGVVLGAIVIMIVRLAQGLASLRNSLSATLVGLERYYNDQATMTSEAAAERLRALELENRALQPQMISLHNAMTSAFDQATGTHLGQIGARLLFDQLPTGVLADQLDKLNAQYQANLVEIQRLDDGLKNNAFWAQDAAAGLEELRLETEELQRQAEETARALMIQRLAGIQEIADTNLMLAGLRRDGTLEAAEDLANSYADQAAMLRNFLIPEVEKLAPGSEEATMKLAEYRAELAEITRAQGLLNGEVLPIIRAREREAEILEQIADRSDEVNDGLQDLNELMVDAGDAGKKVAEAQKAIDQLTIDHGKKQKEITEEAGEEELKIREETAKRILELQAQLDKDILERKESDNLSIEEAVARGDLAAAQSILERQALYIKQQQREAADEAKKQEDERDERLKEHAKELEDSLAREQEKYDRELELKKSEHGKALDEERRLYAEIEAQRQLNALRQKYWNSVLEASYRMLGMSVQDVAAQIAAVTGSLSPAKGGGKWAKAFGKEMLGVPIMDSGGFTRTPGLYYAGVPEYHMPASMAAGGMNGGGMGNTVVFDIDARGSDMTESQWRNIVQQEIAPRIAGAKIEVVRALAGENRKRRRGDA